MPRKRRTAEERRAWEREYRRKNGEKRRAQRRAQYYRMSPVAVQAKADARRARRTAHGNMTRRDMKLQHRYGLTQGEYEAMRLAQGGRCAICGDEPRTTTALVCDHDHETKKVRALLCHWCNAGIGMLRDDARICYAAVEYLRAHGANPKPLGESKKDRPDETPLFDALVTNKEVEGD